MTDPAHEAYDRGDYQTAARKAAAPVLKGLALIKIGNPVDGLPLVAQIDPGAPDTSAETASTIAFGHWLMGKTDEARAVLSTRKNDPLAAGFLSTLSAGSIPCLFQTARSPLLSSVKQVDGFAVTILGSGGQDCDIDLDAVNEAALEKAVDGAAFLFGFDFAGPPPARSAKNGTPYLLHLTDPDVHVLTGLHPVRQYDRALLGTAGQAQAVKAITGVDTVSAPLLGGLSAFHPSLTDLNPGTETTRDTDIFFSGSFGTPIYHEKPARFFAVSQIRRPWRIALHDSTKPLDGYAAALRTAKFALVSVRAPGSFSTRAMQALECGAFVLCEADSGILDFFPGPDWGVFTYRPEYIDEDIARHLSRYDDYAARLAPRQVLIRDRVTALSPGSPKSEERWLKFVAYQALLVRHRTRLGRRPKPVEPALDWFTVRGFPNPAVPIARTRAKAYSALAIQARESGTPPANWLTEDGCFSPLDGSQTLAPSLQPDLTGAFLRVAETWTARDRPAFEAACEAIWQNQTTYEGQALYGLAVPDFWLGVFLNRLGLALGRLYERAMAARAERHPNTEATLLIGALGMVAAERAWADGDPSSARERAGHVAALDPDNHAARVMMLLCDLKAGAAPVRFAFDTLSVYPWHLPRVMALLVGRDALDDQFAGGKLHETYLRFIQRMRDSRPLLSPAKVPAGAAAYLAWKLGIAGGAAAEDVLTLLRREDLLLVDNDTAVPLIVEPILAAAG